ncbi:MAG TPA: HAD family hydrolase [bacterium]|nr:HAD family hydrolase [bacterium]
MAIRTIVFDLDDTLIATAPRYETAITATVDRVAAAFPGAMSAAAIRELQEDIDIAAVRDHGFSVDRFPWTLGETARQVARRANQPCPAALAHELEQYGYAVYDEVPPVFPDTVATLDALAERYELILYTLGIPDLQNRKIDENRLRERFAAVHVVPSKTRAQLAAVIAPRPPASVLVAGDSLRGEIAPAVELGCHAVQVCCFPPWRYNTIPVPGPYDTVAAVSGLLALPALQSA